MGIRDGEVFGRRVAALSVSLVFVFFAGQAAAWAQEGRATVRIDRHALLRVGPTADQTATERARQIERRLTSLLQAESALPTARVEPSADGAARIISVLGAPVVTVTADDAHDNLTTLDRLGAHWAHVIDKALVTSQVRREGPAWRRLGAEALGAFEAAFASVAESALRVVPRALAALLVLAFFWALAALIRGGIRLLFRRIVDDLTVENLIKQVAYYSVWTLGLVIAIDALGLDGGSVATGLGLTGLALGFALKDILSNFVSGILLLVLRPFRVSDQIVVGETEGTVQRVQLRATEVRTYDGRIVLVPNAELFTSRVTNNTAAPVRRASLRVHLGYEVDAERTLAIFVDAVRGTPGVLADPPPSALVADCAEGIIADVRFWADSRRSDFVGTLSNARLALLAAAKREGVALPDPGARKISFDHAGGMHVRGGAPDSGLHST